MLQVDKASGNQGKLSDLFKSPATMKALILTLGLMFFQPLSGINAIIFYSGDIFEVKLSVLIFIKGNYFTVIIYRWMIVRI